MQIWNLIFAMFTLNLNEKIQVSFIEKNRSNVENKFFFLKKNRYQCLKIYAKILQNKGVNFWQEKISS